MSFSVGIVGLPNAGKSTLFKALTRKQVAIAPYAFTTILPNVGKVAVPDKRLEKIVKITDPQKVTPASIEFIDIAGLVKEAHKGEGLGNQFLAQIRECKIILEVVRGFEANEVEHVEKNIKPQRDIEIIKTELILKDLETIQKALESLEKDKKAGDKEAVKKLEILSRIQKALSEEKKISELGLSQDEESLIKDFQFLTAKPVIYLVNSSGKKQELENPLPSLSLIIDLKLEEELSELSQNEIEELKIRSNLDSLIKTCYNILDLITFYTVAGGKETRAWPIKNGTQASEAAVKVHSDFEEKFIKAEIISWEDLIDTGSWLKARELGKVKTVGRDYQIKDGDVIEFKI